MPSMKNLILFTPHTAVDVAGATTFWMRGFTPTEKGAGLTYETSPTPPQGTTLGERWIKFDGNSIVHSWYMRNGVGVFASGGGDGGSTPDNSIRWASRLQFLFRHGTSAGVGDTLPTSDALIWQCPTAGGTLALWYTTTGKLLLIEGGVTVGTGSTTLTVNTDYIIEVWEVRNNNAGVDLANNHFVVRLMSGFGGALPITNEIDGLCDDTSIHLATGTDAGFNKFGEDNARGANYVFYISQINFAFEDADDPYGIVRIDRMDIDGVSALRNEWGGTAADVDDDADPAAPTAGVVADATNGDSVAVISPTTTTARQAYTLSAPSYAVSSDVILALNCGYRKGEPVASKGLEVDYYGGLTDGTTDIYRVQGDNDSALPTTTLQCWETNVSGNPWAHGDLAALEVAVKVVTTDTTSRTANIYAITTFVGYRKDGETTTRLIDTGEPQNLRWRPRKLVTSAPPAQVAPIRNPFVGLFAAAVPPPVSTRRRFGISV